MKIKITEDQLNKIQEDNLLDKTDPIDGFIQQDNITGLAHHYAKADDAGKNGIISKATQAKGEVFAQKIKVRAQGVMEGIDDSNIPNSYSSNRFMSDKGWELFKELLKKNRFNYQDNGDNLTLLNNEKDVLEYIYYEIYSEAFGIDIPDDDENGENFSQDDNNNYELAMNDLPGYSLNEEAPLEETTTTGSVGGQYSSKYFLDPSHAKNPPSIFKGGTVIKANPKQHTSGINSFTVVKGKLNEDIMEEVNSMIANGVSSAMTPEVTQPALVSTHSMEEQPVAQVKSVIPKKVMSRVAELQQLITKAVDTDGDPVGVIDRTSTFESENFYSIIVEDNIITISSVDMYGKPAGSEVYDFNKYNQYLQTQSQQPEDYFDNDDYDPAMNILDDCLGDLNYITRMYKKVINNMGSELARRDADFHKSMGSKPEIDEVDMNTTIQSVPDAGSPAQAMPQQEEQFSTAQLYEIYENVCQDMGEESEEAIQLKNTLIEFGDYDSPENPVNSQALIEFKRILDQGQDIAQESDLNELSPDLLQRATQQSFNVGRLPKGANMFNHIFKDFIGKNLPEFGSIQDVTANKTNVKDIKITFDNQKAIYYNSGQDLLTTFDGKDQINLNQKADSISSEDNRQPISRQTAVILTKLIKMINPETKVVPQSFYLIGDHVGMQETTSSASSGQFSAPLRSPIERPVVEDQVDGSQIAMDNRSLADDDFNKLYQSFGQENVKKRGVMGNAYIADINCNGNFYTIAATEGEGGKLQYACRVKRFPKYELFPTLDVIIETIKGYEGSEDAGETDPEHLQSIAQRPEPSLNEETLTISPTVSNLKRIHAETAKITKADMQRIKKDTIKASEVKDTQFTDNTDGVKSSDSENSIGIDNTPQQDAIDLIPKGMEDLSYATEKGGAFEDRFKDNIDIDLKTDAVTDQFGNKTPAGKMVNVLDTETGKNILANVKKKEKEAEDMPMYVKDPQPVKIVKEGVGDMPYSSDFYDSGERHGDGDAEFMEIWSSVDPQSIGANGNRIDTNIGSFDIQHLNGKGKILRLIGQDGEKSFNISDDVYTKVIFPILKASMNEIVEETDSYLITKAEKEAMNEEANRMKAMMGYKPSKNLSTKGNKRNDGLFKTK